MSSAGGDGGRDEGQEPQLQDQFAEEWLTREQGVQPRLTLTRIHFRLGRRFTSIWWLLPAFVVLCAAMVAAFKLFAATSVARSFLAAHPCIPGGRVVGDGMPSFVLVTHLFNFFLMVMIVRAGLQILADHPRLYANVHCTPGSEWLRFRGPVPTDRVWTAKDDAVTLTPLVGLPGGRHTIGVARHWHFLADILFVANGLAYLVLLFVTGYYRKVVPTDISILPRAASCLITYSSLHLPRGDSGYFRYDALQQLSYFVVVFVAAPLAILTGLAMSPALDNRYRRYQRLFGNRQLARSLHFALMVAFLLFYAVHMVMVAATGFSLNLDRITLGVNRTDLNGVALFLLAIGVAIAFNVWAVRISWTHTRLLQRLSNLTVGRLMDLLFDHYAPRVEYRPEDISPSLWPNGLVPTSEEWNELHESGFRGYRLKVHGLVEHPVELTLEELQRLDRQEQITMHNCIQGWSGIAKWTGVPMRALIDLVKPKPEARWAMFSSFGEGGEGGAYYDSHSLHDLRHRQSLLAYEMNDAPLPVLHGSPLRLRVENQLGFKHVKWIKEIEFVRDFRERGAGHGGYNEDHEFYGYRDEI